MAIYKGFDLNGPGVPKPWGVREQQAWEDLVDTVVDGSCLGVKVTDGNGHRHHTLFNTAGSAAILRDESGVAHFPAGNGVSIGSASGLKKVKIVTDDNGTTEFSDAANLVLLRMGNLVSEGGTGVSVNNKPFFFDSSGNNYTMMSEGRLHLQTSTNGLWYSGGELGIHSLDGVIIYNEADETCLRIKALSTDVFIQAFSETERVTIGDSEIDNNCYPFQLDFANDRGILGNFGESGSVMEWQDGQFTASYNTMLDFTEGHLHVKREYGPSAPTPASGEMVFWHDSDDGKVYLVYNDPVSGVKKVELNL